MIQLIVASSKQEQKNTHTQWVRAYCGFYTLIILSNKIKVKKNPIKIYLCNWGRQNNSEIEEILRTTIAWTSFISIFFLLLHPSFVSILPFFLLQFHLTLHIHILLWTVDTCWCWFWSLKGVELNNWTN